MSSVLTRRLAKQGPTEPAPVPVKKREIKAKTKKTAEPVPQYCSKASIEVMLAQTYDPDRDDPSGWLMSEKLDGVRCYWNGSTLYTRNGIKIRVPAEWTDKLPKIALDGELWTGRDDFHSAVTIVCHKEHGYEDWK